MKNSDVEQVSLAREEWDFSEVPDQELEACFRWEGAREWERFLGDVAAAPINQSDEYISSSQLVEISTNVRGAIEIFQIGTECFSGAFTSPWQTFPQSSRQRALGWIMDDGLTQTSSKWHDLTGGDQTEQRIRSITRSSVSSITGPRSQAVFEINWLQSDNRLLVDFSEWLKQNRKIVPREYRGGNTRDRLKMFGAMRLMHHHTIEDAFSLSMTALKKPLYGKRPSWERARKGALEAFRTYFFIDWTAFDKPPFPASFPKLRPEPRPLLYGRV